MIDQEHTNLDLHVSLCEERYEKLEARITNLEIKVSEIDRKIDEFRLDFFKIMVGSSGSIIVAIIGAVALILTK